MKRPLVIRPSPQGEELCAFLEGYGYEPCFTPLLKIEQLTVPKTFQGTVEHADFIVITSQHCVKQVAPFLQKSTAPIFAIGPATADKLKKYNLSSIYPNENPSTETLLPLITQHITDISGKTGLLLQGKDPRTHLENTLQHMHVKIEKTYLYQRTVVDIDAKDACQQWMTHDVDSVIITSGELLTQLVKTLDAGKTKIALESWIAYVVSSRLMTHALNLGFKRVILTGSASNAAILNSLGTHL